MAIVLTGAASLFTRIGRMGGLLNNVIGHAGENDPSAASRWGASAQTIHHVADGIDNIEAQFAATLQFLMDNLYNTRDAHRASLSQLKTSMRDLAQRTVIEMADADVKLVSRDLTTAMAEVITQMNSQTKRVTKPVIASTVAIVTPASVAITSSSAANPTVILTATVHGFVTGDSVVINGHTSTPNMNGAHIATVTSTTQFTVPVNVSGGGGATGTVRGKGDPVLITSVLGPTGIQRDYLFDEVLDVICATDSQAGGTLGQESFTVLGDNAIADVLEWNWPKGSGASTTLTAIDANTTTGNLLVNSDFETFTVANTPDSWTLDVVVAGTDLFAAGSADAYSNSNALRYTGAGAAAPKGLYQALTTLKPNTVYAVNCWIKRSTSLAAGVLQIDLHNGTAVINDDQAVANSLTITLSSAPSVAYQPLSVITLATGTQFFRTPKILPATIRLRVMITTALTASEHLYIDRLSFVEASELYTRGPYAALFSGRTKSIIKDKYTITVTNDCMSGLGNGSHWQRLAERFFGMRAMDLQFPSIVAASTPEVAETEIISQ